MTETNRGNLSIGLWGYDPAEYLDLTTGQAAATTLHQQRVINYPSVFAPGLSGQITGHYFDDFYNRIHVNPNPLALGNLLSEETRQAYVWNAFFTAQTLDAVTKEDATGISVTEPEAAPTDYAPLEEKTYTIAVSTAGPPTIQASINFEFAVYTITLSITGSRMTLWRWIPQQQYTETLAWKTNILQTRAGEQRIAMRAAPRQIFDFSFFRPAREISQIRTVVDNWSHRVWGLPVWKEAAAGVSAAAGVVSIDCDTAYRDFREDSLAVLWESADKAEAVNVTNVRSDGIDIDPALQNDFANALVMPLRRALTPEGVNFTRGRAQDYSEASASFVVIDNEDLSASRSATLWQPGISITSGELYSPANGLIYEAQDTGTAGDAIIWPKTLGATVTDTNSIPYECKGFGTAQYAGYDVLADGNIIVGEMSERINIPLTQIDNGQGPITIETKQDYSRFRRTMGKYTKTLAALWQWRQWLHSKYGRQKAFWLPSWNRDIHLADTIFSAEVQAEIQPVDLAVHGDFPIDCMIRLASGTIFFRQITGAEYLANGNEHITVDSAFGRDLDPADIDLWCYIDLTRFDSDQIELEHQNPYIMQTNIPTMRVPK
jgi:hypothetical protein